MNFNKKSSINKLRTFLEKKRLTDNDNKISTHIAMGDNKTDNFKGSFSIDDNDIEKFYTLYNKAYIDGHRLHILERPKEQGPIIIDIDLNYELFKNSSPRIYTNYDIKKIVEIYTLIIKKYINIDNNDDDDYLTAYILEKNKPKLINELDEKYEYKDGIHIIFPHICASISLQLLIRFDVVEYIKEDLVLQHLNLKNSIDDVFDIQIIGRNSWLLYGSSKCDNQDFLYKLTKKINFENDNDNDNDSDSDYDINNSFNKIYEYTRLFSIRKFNNEHLPKLNNDLNDNDIKIEYQRKLGLKNNLNNNFKYINNTGNNITFNDINTCKKLIKILDNTRSDNYNCWIAVGLCLKNISNDLLLDWIEFSKLSKKFKNGECEKRWNNFKSKNNGLNIGSLHRWAKFDNNNLYTKIIIQDYENLLSKSLDGSHFKLAEIFKHINNECFVCENIKNKSIYEFKNHKWEYIDSAYTITNKLNHEFYDLYDKYGLYINNQITSLYSENNPENDKLIKDKTDKLKLIKTICKNLHNSSFKDKILSELYKMYYDKTFFDKLDSNKNLICFLNGVYDLDKKEFRNGNPNDYISLCTKINYIEYDKNNEYIIKLEKFFEEIQPNLETRKYLYTLLSGCLHGEQINQLFPILTGNGANGKGRLAKLIENSFGDYATTIDVSFLTQKRISPGSANPQLAKTKGIRIVFVQEPDNNDKLNTGIMKSITGGDYIEARKLYGDPFTIDPQFTTFLICNNLPKIETNDGGTWRRIIAILFKCKFLDNPDPNDINQKKANPYLDKELKLMKEALLSVLINEHNLTRGKITFTPKEVLDETNQYKSDSDIYEQFIIDNLIITKNNQDIINDKELFKFFNEWILNEKKNNSYIDKKTFTKEMTGKLGKLKNSNYIGIVFKNIYDENITDIDNKSTISINTAEDIDYKNNNMFIFNKN